MKYCRSCHTCQVVKKPNQKPNKAPLKPIPTIAEPFSRVSVDCVGSLPKARLGNQCLVGIGYPISTIICVNTRFPEAVSVRNIKAPTIVKALIKFFTFISLLRYI